MADSVLSEDQELGFYSSPLLSEGPGAGLLLITAPQRGTRSRASTHHRSSARDQEQGFYSSPLLSEGPGAGLLLITAPQRGTRSWASTHHRSSARDQELGFLLAISSALASCSTYEMRGRKVNKGCFIAN
ncbi:hypothetical protein NHX12_002490 [Muraenolepis orangiensis]|uniref:Uncharacterized protein n=1 Tax=Muraenolepis orangiensis TaxID=630683 RepID=A0A9Q0IGF4_9TELE|nr:hypothetical protein NHX12_002490 [Muraenolepis orangiensis]